MHVSVCSFVAAFAALFVSSCEAVSWEHMLVKHLKRKYPDEGQLVRPVQDSSQSVPLYVGMTLNSFRFHRLHQSIQANAYLNMNWTDSYLKWNPAYYGGIQAVRMRPTDVWTPDLTLYNVNGNAKFSDDFLLMVFSNGNVLWVPQLPFTADCPVPDPNANKQSCPVKFGSWTYNGNQIKIDRQSDKVDLSNLQKDREWEVVSAPVVKETKHYPCCTEPYETVTFTLNLKKK